MKEQIKWYFSLLFYSIATPIFVFVLTFEYLNGGREEMIWETPINSEFWHYFWMDAFGLFVAGHGFIELTVVAFIVIFLFTYPFESGLSFFEFSLPDTKGKNFWAKYIVSLVYLFLLFSLTYVFATYIKINEFGGLEEPYLYLHILFILFDTFYILSILILFAVLFKRTIGVIVGLLSIFLMEGFVIAPERIWLPPTIYFRPVLSFDTLLNYYQYALIIGVIFTFLSYLIYRRCEL